MGLYPRNLNEYVSALGIPRGPKSNAFLVDTVNGDDDNPGTSWEQPLKSVEAAYALCVADQHDTVLLLANDTADNPTALLTWSKDYTHLIGIGCNLPGIGQRCRIVGTSTLGLPLLATFSGNGCIVKNIQFYNGDEDNEDTGAVLVSGGRNHFINCMFAGMAHTTPAARAGGYSLEVSGSENTFEKCSIGLQTIIRAAANAELIISGTTCYRNRFVDCEFISWSVTAGKLLVKFAAASVPWTTKFINCIFDNLDMSAGGADGASIDNAIGDSSTAKHHIELIGKTFLCGCTGVADTLTNVYGADANPGTGFGLSVNPAA